MSFQMRYGPRFHVLWNHLKMEKKSPHDFSPQELERIMDDSFFLKPQKPLDIIGKTMWYFRKEFFVALLISLITEICEVVVVASTTMALKETGFLLKTAIIISIAYMSSKIILILGKFFRGLMMGRLYNLGQLYLNSAICEKILKLSGRRKKELNDGNLKVLAVSDSETVLEFLLAFMWNLFPLLASLCFAIPLLYHFVGMLGIIGFLSGIVQVPVYVYLSKKTMQISEQGWKARDQMTLRIGEWLKFVRESRMTGLTSFFKKSIHIELLNYLKKDIKKGFINIILFGTSTMWWLIPILTMILVSYFLKIDLGYEKLFGSIWLISFIMSKLRMLPYVMQAAASAYVSSKRIYELLSSRELKDDLYPDTFKGSFQEPLVLEFENVSFKYEDDDKYIFEDISIKIFLKERTGMIGSVASGKSTFLKLATGELFPTSGKIWIHMEKEKVHLQEVSCFEWWRSFFGWVGQEPFAASASIASNISLSEEMDEKNLQNLLQDVALSVDSSSWPDGIYTEVGERGVNLSGGQKQRLNIARAFYAPRPFVFLDDPLSAVDVEVGKILSENLKKRYHGLFLASHRMDILNDFDHIIELEEKKIKNYNTPSCLKSDPRSLFSQFISSKGVSHEG